MWKAKTTTVIGFDDIEAASAEYIAREKDTIREPAIQVVMVSGESVSAIKKGYPNYYLDAAEFLDYVEQLTDTARGAL